MKKGYPPRPLEDRFFEKVKKTKGCWKWLGSTETTKGYGVIWFGNKKTLFAHRVSYEIHVGKIPEGLQIDHLCRNRSCVNPKHMEVVTLKENVLRGEGITARNLRKTHCPLGHEYSKENTYVHRNSRQCKICKRKRK